MTPERWRLIEEIFHAVLKLPENERQAFLDRTCGGDAQLRSQIEQLLDADASPEMSLESRIGAAAAAFSDMSATDLTDRSIGPYKMIRQIGAGGMGVVYLAEDTRLRRRVALKLLPEFSSMNSDRLRRFQLEAQSASAINHPNIVTIHEVEKIENFYFIVSEYIEGQTFAERLKSGPVPIAELLDLFVQAADGLSEAHRAGIVHRDIKPGNMMITNRGTVKLLDFGLAKIMEKPNRFDASQKTESGLIFGTVQYMSPEQTMGKTIDHRTDLFSLGVVMFEMITGQHPFKGDNQLEVLQKIIQGPPESTERKDVPVELERIVKKCLEKDPDRRYQNAQELVIDLKALRRSIESGEKIPVSGRNWTPKKFRISHVLAPLLLLLIALTIFYATRPADSIHSLAVLPFINSAGDPNADYLSDGLSETIIYRLSQLPNFKIIAPATVFRYKGKEVNPKTVGKELDVRALMLGRISKREDSIVVSAELIDTGNNRLIWGERYTRKMTDLLVLQEEIATAIAEKLKLKLSPENQKKLTKDYTANVNAYEFYLKGRYHWNQRTEEGLRKSIEDFHQAIESDPEYALAYTGLSDSYSALPYYSNEPPREAFTKSIAAAQKAIEIDDSLAEAHASLGSVYHDFFQWDKSRKELLKAIALNPNYAPARYWYGSVLARNGKWQEGMNEIRRAEELDPLSIIVHMIAGYAAVDGGDYDLAMRKFQEALELDQNFGPAYMQIGLCHLWKKEYKEALTALEKAEKIDNNASVKGSLGYFYAVTGEKEKAKMLLQQLREESQTPDEIALIYIGLGDKDHAFEFLNRAFDQNSTFWLAELEVHPIFDPIRSDARYLALLHRMSQR